ncbi:MAG: response regulator [Gemmatimonadetes bacterium]|nr:response regulator [Gemmatimonadota bacterium]
MEKPSEKILIVDDESSIRKIISFQLERSGYETISASNGREGVEAARRNSPDLILLDLMMPEMDGHQVVEALKADYLTSQIPIIILTAKFAKSDRMAGLSAGVNDYLTKPFELAELLVRIRNVLDWSKKQRSANPLTGLPGNVTIEEQLEKVIRTGEQFSVVYVDLDNFKAYNDYYGYNQGDKAIRELARILIDGKKQIGCGDEFVGHIGGDDFLYIAPPAIADAIGHWVIDEFAKMRTNLIRPDDLRKGHIEVRGRTGEITRYPLLSVTLAIVSNEDCEIDHVAKVGDLASEVKVFGKSIPGSVLVKDRRIEKSEPAIATGEETESAS